MQAPEHQKVQKGDPYLTYWSCANDTQHIHLDIQIWWPPVQLEQGLGVRICKSPEFLLGLFKSLLDSLPSEIYISSFPTKTLYHIMAASSVPPLKGTLDHSHCICLSYYATIHTSDTERWAKFRLTSVVSPLSDSSLWGPYGTKFFTETPFGRWDYLIKKWRCLSHRNPNFVQELAPCLLGEISGLGTSVEVCIRLPPGTQEGLFSKTVLSRRTYIW